MVYSKNECIRTEKRFRLILLHFRFGGILMFIKEVPKVSYLYSVIAVFSFYLTYIGLFLGVTVYIHELDRPMYNVRVWFGLTLCVFIHLSVSARKSKIEELISFTELFTWEELADRDSTTGQLTQAGLLKRIEKVVRNATIIVLLYHTLQSGFRIITERDVILPVWFPFDIYSSPTYELLLISQVFASIVPAMMVCGFMLLYATMVIIACIQLEKLRTKLSEIRSTTNNSFQMDTKDEGKEYNGQVHHCKEHFSIMQNKLNECVKLHQLILQYMEMLEYSMNLVLGGWLLLNLIGLCIYAFSSVMTWGDAANVSQGLAGYIMFILNVYIICITGAELTKEAQSIRDAAWDCDWIGAPLPFQKSVMFMIARANKEFTVTAAKFVPVSMVTFMNIMQQTMSYFMFLLEMKDRNKNA